MADAEFKRTQKKRKAKLDAMTVASKGKGTIKRNKFKNK